MSLLYLIGLKSNSVNRIQNCVPPKGQIISTKAPELATTPQPQDILYHLGSPTPKKKTPLKGSADELFLR